MILCCSGSVFMNICMGKGTDMMEEVDSKGMFSRCASQESIPSGPVSSSPIPPLKNMGRTIDEYYCSRCEKWFHYPECPVCGFYMEA